MLSIDVPTERIQWNLVMLETQDAMLELIAAKEVA